MRPTVAALVLCVLVATVAGTGAAIGSPASGGDAAPAAPPQIAAGVEAAGAGPPAVGDASAAAGPSAAATTGQAAAVQAAAPATDALQEDDGDEPPALNVTSAHEIEIQVRADGSARFSVTWAFPAESESEQDAFARLAEDFQDGEFDVAPGAFENVVDDVEDASGRSMSLENVDRGASVSEGTGELTLAFTWTNFAETSDEEEIVVDDGFETDDGVWLRSLGPQQTLILRAPDGYGVTHSESLVQDNAVVWEGPTAFESGDFRTVFDGSPSLFDSWLALGGLGLLLVGVGGTGLWWLYGRRDTRGAEPTAASGEGGPTPTGDGGATVEEPADGAGAGAAAGSAAAAGAAADDGADDESAADDEDDGIDPELLSDEERVERLLERNGGRMKQARIVDETGWSNAKVSQLLSKMAEEDRVDKLRLGRENLITLPDEDVTATE